MDTTPIARALHVPDEAVDALADLRARDAASVDYEPTVGQDQATIRVIAGPVVAAELRAMADHLTAIAGGGYVDAFLHRGAYNSHLVAVAQQLRDRADEIDAAVKENSEQK